MSMRLSITLLLIEKMKKLTTVMLLMRRQRLEFLVR
jgi:hypothetical protein